MRKIRSSVSGFTFIEMLIVVAVLAIALPALFSVLFVILKQQNKIYRLSEIKRQGDFAVSVMSNTIRNHAEATYSSTTMTDANRVCADADEEYSLPYFQDNTNGASWFRYSFSSNKIASASSVAGASGDLTNSLVVVQANGAEPLIKCERAGLYSPPTVVIKFTMCYQSCSLTNPADIASMDYSVRVPLKTF